MLGALGLLQPLERVGPIALIVRSTLIFFVLVFLTRVMGKQQVGRLAPIAFASAISIGTIAAEPLTGGETPVAAAVVSMATMTAAWVGLAWLAMRSNWMKDIVGDRPVLLVSAGKVLRENLVRARMTLDDLLSQLRLAGAPGVDDVECAVLEPTGQLSVIKRAQAQPVTPADLGVATPYRGLPAVMIYDGRVQRANLRRAGLSEAWLADELARQAVYDPTSVFLAVLDGEGRLSVGRR